MSKSREGMRKVIDNIQQALDEVTESAIWCINDTVQEAKALFTSQWFSYSSFGNPWTNFQKCIKKAYQEKLKQLVEKVPEKIAVATA